MHALPRAATDAVWAAPSTRARAAAVALAVAFAALTMVLVDRAWHRTAPAARAVAGAAATPAATAVGVTLIPAPSRERASSVAPSRVAR